MYSERQYPWKGRYQGFTGAFTDTEIKYFVEGHKYIGGSGSKYYDCIDKQLHIQPLAAAIRMTNTIYKWKGIGVMQYSDKELNQIKKFPLHAITLVGYGVEGDKEYYIIHNSYGLKYGLKWGYKGRCARV